MDETCNDVCVVKLDLEQFNIIYDELDEKVTKRLNADYDCKKINGATLAATWSAVMSPAVGQILNSIVALQNNETSMDRCVKQEQCDSSKATTTRNDDTAIEQIVSSKSTTIRNDTRASTQNSNETCMATADCNIKGAQQEKVEYETATVLPTTVALTERQTAGFDDNLRQKLFEAQMNSWAMMFSSGLLNEMPCFIQSDEASHLYNGIITKTMPATFTPPPGGCSAEDTTS